MTSEQRRRQSGHSAPADASSNFAWVANIFELSPDLVGEIQGACVVTDSQPSTGEDQHDAQGICLSFESGQEGWRVHLSAGYENGAAIRVIAITDDEDDMLYARVSQGGAAWLDCLFGARKDDCERLLGNWLAEHGLRGHELAAADVHRLIARICDKRTRPAYPQI